MRTPIDSSLELQGKTPAGNHRRRDRGQALRGSRSSPPAKISGAQHADRRHPAMPAQPAPDEFLSLIQQAQRMLHQERKPEPPSPSLSTTLQPPHAMMPVHAAAGGTVHGAPEIGRNGSTSGGWHGLVNSASGSDATLKMAVGGAAENDVASPVRTAVSRAERGAIESPSRQQPLRPAIGHEPGAQASSAAAAPHPRTTATIATAAVTTQSPQQLPDRCFVSYLIEPRTADKVAPAWQLPLPNVVRHVKLSTGRTAHSQIAAALAQLQPVTHQTDMGGVASGAAPNANGEGNLSDRPAVIAEPESERAADTTPPVPNQPAASAETMTRAGAVLRALPQQAAPASGPGTTSLGQVAGASAPHGATAAASGISSSSLAIELKIDSAESESIHVRVRLGHDRFHLKITADSDTVLEALYAGQQTLDEALAAAHPAAAPPHVEILRHAEPSPPLVPESFDGATGGAGRELRHGAAQGGQSERAIDQTPRKESAKENGNRIHAAARSRAAGIYL